METNLLVLNEVLIWRQKTTQDEELPTYPFFEVVRDRIVLYREPGKVKKGWSPSTCFDDAMEVAWKLKARGFIFEMYGDPDKNGFFVSFCLPHKYMPVARDESLMLAVCKAALLIANKDNFPPEFGGALP